MQAVRVRVWALVCLSLCVRVFARGLHDSVLNSDGFDVPLWTLRIMAIASHHLGHNLGQLNRLRTMLENGRPLNQLIQIAEAKAFNHGSSAYIYSLYDTTNPDGSSGTGSRPCRLHVRPALFGPASLTAHMFLQLRRGAGRWCWSPCPAWSAGHCERRPSPA